MSMLFAMILDGAMGVVGTGLVPGPGIDAHEKAGAWAFSCWIVVALSAVRKLGAWRYMMSRDAKYCMTPSRNKEIQM